MTKRIFWIFLGLMMAAGIAWGQQYNTSGGWVGSDTRRLASTTEHLGLGVVADEPANDRFQIRADGQLSWGGGAAVPDVDLGRSAAGVLSLTTGTMAAAVQATSLATGTLTINAINLATAAAQYDIADGECDAAADVGKWVTVVLEDASTVISITSLDASNIIRVPGLALGAGDELDSVSTALHESQHITLTCLAADNWYMTGGNLTNATGAAIAWADGGAT